MNNSTPYLSVRALALGFATLTALAGVSGGATAQGPKLGAKNDGTPKPGIYLNGPMRWGRLVDIKSKDGAIEKPNGTVDEFYLDTVISEAVGLGVTAFTTTDDTKGKPREAIVTLTLETDPDSGHESLRIAGIIKNPPGVNPTTDPVAFSKSPKSAFQKTYKKVTGDLGLIKVGGPSSLPPYSVVPRDAAIVMEFDRPINANTIGPDTIQFYAGVATSSNQLPPAPFMGRFIFKPETPRFVYFQPTIGDIDDNRIEASLEKNKTNKKKYPKINPQILPLNSVGFPASQSTTTFNIAVFMPAEYSLKNGITRIVLGKDGSALNTSKSVTKFSYNPTNPSAPTGDDVLGVVRVFRSGNSGDPNSGFLADKTVPFILGTQPISIDSIDAGNPNIITTTFVNTACDLGIRIGDSVRQGSARALVAEVIDNTLAPTYTIRVEYLDPSLAQTFNTIDSALLTTTFTSALATKAGCFLLVAPQPAVVTSPLSGVDPQATFTVRFSKPMNAANLNPFENFALLTNSTLAQPSLAGVFEKIVTNVIPSPDLKQFKVLPFLPMPHTQGSSETMKLMVVAGTSGLTDLAGNALSFSQFSFAPTIQLEATSPSNTSRNFSLVFDALFEGPAGGPYAGPQTLVNGQVTQPNPGFVSGRPSTHFSRTADPSNPFVQVMPPFTQGIQTPLSALGSRLMTVYRHIDLNLSVNAITDLDLDIEQLSWAPFGATFSDFFKLIRIDIAHSKFFPDEFINQTTLLPQYPSSGLSESSFVNNIFEVADHPEVALYNGSYQVNPNSAFVAASGTIMMPWPKFTKTYTWRDSSYGSKKFGAPNGNGVNPDQYYFVLGQNPAPVGSPDHPWGSGLVPSLGLPILMDFRTYPAEDPNTKGLNGFQVAIAVGSSSKPNFRVYSTGGLDTTQAPKTVVPDIAPDGTQPTGGYFPPGSTQGPPGTKTPPGGPEVYWGQVDFAVKVSRVYSHYYDLTTNVAGQPTVTTPQFNNSNQILIPTAQAPNTSVAVDYRGATTVSGGALTDARCFDAYGEAYPNANTVPPAPTGVNCGSVTGIVPATGSAINYTQDMTVINGKRFVQMRFTFTSDIVNNVSPSITAFGFAYSNP